MKKASVNLKANFKNKFSKNQQQISDTSLKSLHNIFLNKIANDCNLKPSVNLNKSFNFINSNQAKNLGNKHNSQLITSLGVRCGDESITFVSNKEPTQINDLNLDSSLTESSVTYESEDHEMNE